MQTRPSDAAPPDSQRFSGPPRTLPERQSGRERACAPCSTLQLASPLPASMEIWTTQWFILM